jgi:hypothetical protein
LAWYQKIKFLSSTQFRDLQNEIYILKLY